MDSLFWQRTKIPTVLGVAFIIFLLVGLGFATQNLSRIQSILSFADQQSSPSSLVKIANTTDSSFTVYWTTDMETGGAVFYGKSSSLGDGVAVDDRDLTQPNGKYKTHHVRVSGLQAETKYYFKVGSSQPDFGDPSKNGSPFEITTGPIIANAPQVDPIYGKVLNTSGSPYPGALVIWNSSGSQEITSLTKTDGTYVLPIGLARTQDLKSFINLKKDQAETIAVISGNGEETSIKCISGHDRPLPDVKLGQSIDCQNRTEKSSNQRNDPSTSSARFKIPTRKSGSRTSSQVSTQSGSVQLNISSGQTVDTPFPVISGKAKPKQVIKIQVHSETPYSGTVVAGPDGSWSWTPPAGLSPGPHQVTITIVNADGTTQTVTRTFTVVADEPILPVTSGTPSAQPTHLACVNNACQSVSAAGSDTCTSDSDCEQIVEPTTPPVTGSDSITTLAVLLGLVLIVISAGFVLTAP